jgi:cephalosporin hydroxylase
MTNRFRWSERFNDMPIIMISDRPWAPGDNPKTAVWECLKSHPESEIDKSIQHKLLITVAPDGYLRRVRSLAFC